MKAKLLRMTGPVLVLATGIGIFTLLKATAPTPSNEGAAQRPVTVYTHVATRTEAQLEVHTQGEVRARTAIDLTSQVSGRILEVSPEYTEGGRFAPDTVLLRIDDSDYRLALSQAEAAVAAAQLNLEQAVADADVARKQLRNVADASDLALKKPQILDGKAQLSAAQAALEQARLDLARTELRLPFAGRVATTTVHVGEYISAGAPLGGVFATDRVQVRLPLNDQQLAALGLPIGFAAEGDAPVVQLSADVAGQRHEWQGRLERIDAAVDSSTRLIYATAEVDDPYGAGRSAQGMPLAVGLFVDARIAGRELQSAVRIPSRGLRPGNRVFVVDASGLLDIRTAEVEQLTPDHAVLRSGLLPGERLVISTLRNPIAGMSLLTIDEERYADRSE